MSDVAERAFDTAEKSAWQIKTLGEVCRTSSGGTPSRSRPDFFTGDIPWVKSGELTDGLVSEVSEFISEEALAGSSAKLLPTGTLLIAMYGATVGKLGVLARAAATNQAICAIFPPPELDPKFLFWYLRRQRSDLIAKAVGGAQPNISQTILRDLELPIPPIDEQREIVAEIEKQFSRLDEAVANLQRVKANLKRYEASVLKSAVEGRLVETDATLALEKQKKFESATELLQQAVHGRRLKTFSAPEQGFAALPEGWAWASVEQLAAYDANSIGAGPFGTIFKAKDFRSEGVPIIFLRHVSPLKYLTHKPGFMDVGKWEELFRPYSVFGGELLITKLGEPPGVCARYPVGIGPAMVTPDVIKLSVNSQLVSSEYLMYYFNSDPAKRFATGAAFGTTRTRLTLPLFREMPVPLPPLTEQTRIVAEVDLHLSIIREVETEVDVNIQRAQALRQATLSRAFLEGVK